MLRATTAKIGLALTLISAGSGGAVAGGDRCNCQPPGFYPGYFAPPASIHDHTGGSSWSANGWRYPPVGVVYPQALAPPPRHDIRQWPEPGRVRAWTSGCGFDYGLRQWPRRGKDARQCQAVGTARRMWGAPCYMPPLPA